MLQYFLAHEFLKSTRSQGGNSCGLLFLAGLKSVSSEMMDDIYDFRVKYKTRLTAYI